jgi:MFS family permease
MSALDVVVVSTALPTLRTQLGASLPDLEWTINAYSLVFGCLMLTGAALGDRFGRRRMYVTGLLIFVLGSALAALAPSVGLLIAARVVQGAGGAVLVPLTLTLISDAFPTEQRGTAIGIWGGVTGLGVAAGPVVGGAIVQGISWQWIFWVNVPIGLAVAALSALRLRESRGPRPHLDIAGLILAGTGAVRPHLGADPGTRIRLVQRPGHRVAGSRSPADGRVPDLGTAGSLSDAAAGLFQAAGLLHR